MQMKKIDDIDRSILHELVRNGRLSNKELAERVGLSPAPCWQRLRRLEEEGYIDGYSARLNHERLDYPETVLVEVNLDRHDKESVRAFGEAIVRIPEVLEIYLVTGGFDYFLKVAVSGTKDYEHFLQEKLYQVGGIRQTQSIFTLRCLKREFSVDISRK